MAEPTSSNRLFIWLSIPAVMLLGAVAFLLARPALAPRLEAFPDLAKLTAPPPPPVVEEAPVEATPEPEPEEPQRVPLTYEQIETMLAPLPEQVLTLIEDGRQEIRDKQYKSLGSSDRAQASRSQRFFQIWGRTWNNRLDRLVEVTPPMEDCRIHAALEPACVLLEDVYGLLREVPGIATVKDGRTIIDSAQQLVEDFLNPPEVEEEDEELVTEP